MSSRICLGLAVVISLAVRTHPAGAVTDSDKQAIRVLANDGAADYAKGRFEPAREKFTRAFAIAKVPRLALLAARANEKLGRLVAAYELYRQAIALERNDLWLAKTQEQAQAEAKQELAALQPRIPRLTIRVEGASAAEVTVSVDGEAVPSALLGIERYVDPGTRSLVGTFGAQQLEQSVILAEGEKKQALLKFEPSDAPAGPDVAAANQTHQSPSGSSASAASLQVTDSPPVGRTQRTVGWVGVGVGAAGLVLGATAGAIVAGKYSDLNENCKDRSCDPAYESRVNSYDRWQTLSTVGFIVGGVGLATGITLLLTSPKRESKPSVSLWMGPAALTVKGDF